MGTGLECLAQRRVSAGLSTEGDKPRGGKRSVELLLNDLARVALVSLGGSTSASNGRLRK